MAAQLEDNKGELSYLRRTAEIFILETFLEPALDEEQDASKKGGIKNTFFVGGSTMFTHEYWDDVSAIVDSNRLFKSSKRRSLVENNW